MQLFQLARHPTRWIRLALWVLTLTLALNTLAHAAHSHNSNTETVACGYCVTFNGLTEASHAPQLILRTPAPDHYSVNFSTTIPRTAIRIAAQPRGPPQH